MAKISSIVDTFNNIEYMLDKISNDEELENTNEFTLNILVDKFENLISYSKQAITDIQLQDKYTHNKEEKWVKQSRT